MTGGQGLPSQRVESEVRIFGVALDSQIPKSLCAVAWTMLPPRLALLASCLTPAATMGTFPEAHPHAGTAVVFSVFYGTFLCPMSLCLPIGALALVRPHPTALRGLGCVCGKRTARRVSQDGMLMSVRLCVDARNTSASARRQVP